VATAFSKLPRSRVSGSEVRNPGAGRGQCSDVGVHHQTNQLLDTSLRLPAKAPLCLGGVAEKQVHLGGADELGVDDYMVAPVQPDMREGHLQQFLDRMCDPVATT